MIDVQAIVIVVSTLTSLIREQRDGAEGRFTTHQVYTRATTGSRHNGKRQGQKRCTVLISSGLCCYLEESTVQSSV